MFEALKVNSKLYRLLLSGVLFSVSSHFLSIIMTDMNITESGITLLSDALNVNSSLRHLCLERLFNNQFSFCFFSHFVNNNNIGGSGMALLSKALMVNSHINHFYLSICSFLSA